MDKNPSVVPLFRLVILLLLVLLVVAVEGREAFKQPLEHTVFWVVIIVTPFYLAWLLWRWWGERRDIRLAEKARRDQRQ
jgi:hypothetical protein